MTVENQAEFSVRRQVELHTFSDWRMAQAPLLRIEVGIAQALRALC